MMDGTKLDILAFIRKECPVLDVRTPAEFRHGHIPGALNLPLFSNEERSLIGTLYVQQGSKEAVMKGLELTGPRLTEFVGRATSLAPLGEVALYCWRGGMRSNSMAWLFNTSGLKAFTLLGGYKSWRRHIHGFFNNPFRLIVIGGMTGSGKTEILEEVEKMGHQVIHLERLASHKGSVFGHLGMYSQPTTEQFENDLYDGLSRMNLENPVFIEDESLAIGQVFLPRPFYERMSVSPFINVVVPFERRVEHLVRNYAGWHKNELIAAILKIENRLGSQNARNAIRLVENGEMTSAVEIVLHYYDKIYSRSMSKRSRDSTSEIRIENELPGEIAKMIIQKFLKS